jgi:hypothetical protein
MENNMRAFLIKPDTPENFIEEIDYDGDWQTIAPLISYEGHTVDLFELVRITPRHVMFVDESGLLNNPEHFIAVRGLHSPLAGRGLVLGDDDSGDCVAATLSIAELRANMLPCYIDPEDSEQIIPSKKYVA